MPYCRAIKGDCRAANDALACAKGSCHDVRRLREPVPTAISFPKLHPRYEAGDVYLPGVRAADVVALSLDNDLPGPMPRI